MINAKDWALSLDVPGEGVEDMEDIVQCVKIIFTTQKKSDPFRPDFGIDLLAWIDVPVNIAAPGIVAEMLAALEYEPRAEINNLTYLIEFSKITFNLQGNVKANVKQKIKLEFVFFTEEGLLLLTENNNTILA